METPPFMTEYFVKSRVVWQLGPRKIRMIVPLRQLNVCRVVWLLIIPKVRLLCSESDGVVAGTPEGPGRY